MPIETPECDVSLPGYQLVERIGAGGYAQVWRAEAPGGIQKAVKVVYGYYDDEFASQELKALERIKGVRHPFLLSLERFEIVNGRLTILTELADMSLEQRLRQCRAEGLAGIPRDELLRYMTDAAEALDFLAQRHSLLHLDIKPENLLILGDHVKVADFGLVKELATRTQNSLVSGMTPTYASPEMFDDEPSAASDQYSLAIVYQEMLVGSLPFPGRTAAQLAKQHTQAEPQLNALPPHDQAAVARALSKKPEARFPSCGAFVDALKQGTSASERAPIAAPAPSAPVRTPQPTVPKPDDTKSQSFCTTLRRTPEASPKADPLVTRPVQRQAAADAAVAPAPAVLEPQEIIDVAVPEIGDAASRCRSTFYLAAGGVGIQILRRLRERTAGNQYFEDSSMVAMAAVDTDRDELREACSSRWQSPLAADDALHLPLRLPGEYDNVREILGWVSRRWLYNIPRSLETRGYRPLGRVALVDHRARALELLERKLTQIAPAREAGQNAPSPIKVVLLAGTGGGTGGGMLIDLANAIRRLASAHGLLVELEAHLVCTCVTASHSSPLAAANTLALITELEQASSDGGSSQHAPGEDVFAWEQAPFDAVYFLPSKVRNNEHTADTMDSVARHLALEAVPEARQALRACRISPTPREAAIETSSPLRTYGTGSRADQQRRFLDTLADSLVNRLKHYWLSKSSEPAMQTDSAARPSGSTRSADGGNASDTEASEGKASEHDYRQRFEQFGSLVFAHEVLRQVNFRLAEQDERGRPLLTLREAPLVVDAARMTIRTALLPSEPSVDKESLADELRPLVIEAGRRVVQRAISNFDARHMDALLPETSFDEALRRECHDLLHEKLNDVNGSKEIARLLDPGEALGAALEETETSVFQCSAERRTLCFVPATQDDGDIRDRMQALRPRAAVLKASVDDVLLIAEQSGISPRSVAIGLDHVFPGIAEAASRLHTRIDIQWKPLL